MPDSPLTVTATPEACYAWEWRLKKFNDGSGEPPLTLPEYMQARFDDSTSKYQSQILEEQKRALASNTRMVAIGSVLLQLSDEELDTKLAQIEAIIS